MTQEEIIQRLAEIADQKFGSLEASDVAALLEERATLEVEKARLEEEAARKANEARFSAEVAKAEVQEKRKHIQAEIAELNEQITADQDDVVLLAIVERRRELERMLEEVGPEEVSVSLATDPVVPEPAEVSVPKEIPVAPTAPAAVPIPELELETEPEAEPQPEVIGESLPTPVIEDPIAPARVELTPAPEEIPERVEEVAIPEGEEKLRIDTSIVLPEKDSDHEAPVPTSHVNFLSTSGRTSALMDVPEDTSRIALEKSGSATEYPEYLSELKANAQSLGTFLQGLPIAVKRSRSFMLEVAKIDPAYAMHYADKDTLKKDEAFNVSVAALPNHRNSGNPLSEMLPEMRTGQVVLLGVKNDFRNVRFIDPRMPEYDEILAVAKKGILASLEAQHGAHNSKAFVPLILQKDKAFMEEIDAVLKKYQ